MNCEKIHPRPWAKLYGTNQTSNSFAALPPTTTQPFVTRTQAEHGLRTVTEGFIPVEGAETLELALFGAGADNTTFDARIIGWSPVGAAIGGIGPQWIPSPIADISCTLCAQTGATGGVLISTDRMVDTITVSANQGVAVATGVQAEETMAGVVVDITGFEYVQVVFDMTGATNGNCLYSTY